MDRMPNDCLQMDWTAKERAFFTHCLGKEVGLKKDTDHRG